jgi:TP901 family phage tail tape measure protein
MPPAATATRGFRIASSYVEVNARVNRAQMRRQAEIAGRQGGSAFSRGFGTASRTGMRRQVSRLDEPLRGAQRGFTAAGQGGGRAYATGFTRSANTRIQSGLTTQVTTTLHQTTSAFAGAGQQGGTGFTQGVSQGMSGVPGAFKPVGVAVAATAAMIGANVLGVSGDFEAAMNGVRAVTGATGKDFKKLRDQAKLMGSTTAFSATEAANAMEFMGMAGFKTGEIYAALPDVLALAAAGNTDLATTADIASNIMSGFGIEAKEMARVSDVLAAAMAGSNVDLRMLGESMKYAAPLASAAGWSFEDTAAAVGFLGNAGIQGSMAGTGLNSVLATLADTSSTGGKKLKEFGVAAMDSKGEVRPLVDIVEDLADKGAGVADVMGIFGLEAGPKLQALVGQGADGLRKFAAELKDSEGAAKRMADIRMEGLTGEMKGARSAIEGFMIQLGDLGILDVATQATNMFAGAVRKLTGWLTDNEGMVKQVVQGIGAVVAGVGGVVGVVLLVKGAMLLLAGAMGVLLSPIGLVALAVAGLVAGFVVAWKRSERFREIVTAVWERVKEAAAQAVAFFKAEVWPVLQNGWTVLQERAKKVGAFFKDTLWPMMQAGWETFRDAAQPVVDTIMGFFDDIGGKGKGLQGIWDAVVDTVGGRMNDLWKTISTIMDSVSAIWKKHGDTIMAVVSFVWSWISNAISLSLGIIWSVVKGAWTMISGVISGALQGIRGLVQFWTGVLTGDWKKAWEGIKNIFGGIWKMITSILRGGFQIITGIFSNIWKFIKGIFTRIYDWLVGNSIVPDLVNAIIRWFTVLRDRGAQLFAMLRDWVVGRITAMAGRVIAAVLGLRERMIGQLTGMRDRAVAIAAAIRERIVGRMRSMRDQTASAVRSLRDRVVGAFQSAVSGVRTAWNKLRDITRRPVNFIINTVYEKGIRKVWGAVVGAFGGRPLPEVKGMARGGILAGRSSFRQGDDQLVPMRRGEGVYVSEAMSDPYERARLRAVNNAAMAGRSLAPFQREGDANHGFALGGIFDGIGNAAAGAWDVVKKSTSWLKDTFGGAIKAGVSRVIDPLIARIPGSGRFPGVLRGAARKAVDRLLGAGDEGDKVAGKFHRPVNAPVGTRYGVPGKMWSSGFHTGTDFPAPTGTAVRAAMTGRVASTRNGGPYGKHISMTHAGGLSTLYAHLSSMVAGAGTSVGGGSRIGGVGSTGNSTGPHLHFEARRNGRLINPESLFDDGGVLRPGETPVANGTGRPEAVLTDAQWAAVSAAAARPTAGEVFTGDIHVHVEAKTLKDMQDVVNLFDKIQQTARQHGSKTRVGVR